MQVVPSPLSPEPRTVHVHLTRPFFASDPSRAQVMEKLGDLESHKSMAWQAWFESALLHDDDVVRDLEGKHEMAANLLASFRAQMDNYLARAMIRSIARGRRLGR